MLYMLLATSAFGIGAPENGINRCLEEISSVLERSGESASDVAEATVQSCAVGRGEPAPGTVGAQMTREDFRATQALLREVSTDMVRLKIVRMRACRKSPGCAVPDIGLRDRSSVGKGAE